jgi:hypothetical protein
MAGPDSQVPTDHIDLCCPFLFNCYQLFFFSIILFVTASHQLQRHSRRKESLKQINKEITLSLLGNKSLHMLVHSFIQISQKAKL